MKVAWWIRALLLASLGHAWAFTRPLRPLAPLLSPLQAGTSPIRGAVVSAATREERAALCQSKRFQEWLGVNGVKASKVRVGSAGASRGEGGVGLRATEAVSRGEVVASVPFSLCFTGESVRGTETTTGRSLGSYLTHFDGWTGAVGVIALGVMYEQARGDASRWAPWLQTLPQPGDPGALDLPMFWSETDQAMLATCSTRTVMEFSREVAEDFVWLQEHVFAPHPDVFPPEMYTLGRWRHAVALAVSRSFFIDGATRLAPLVDMANHDERGGRELEAGRRAGALGVLGGGGGAGKEVRLVAGKAYGAGEEVCVSYGVRAAAEFVEEFGFMPPEGSASADMAEMVFDVAEAGDPSRDDKLDIVEEAGLDDTISFYLSGAPGAEPDPEMVQFLRLRCLAGGDLFLLEPVFRKEVLEFMALPVSPENEAAVGDAVIERCVGGLGSLEAEVVSSGGEGEGDGLGDGDAPKRALARALRRSEVRVLEATARWWRRDKEFLKGKEYYQERRLKELNLDKPWSPDGETESTFSTGRSPGNVDWGS